jgi:hypothetical protein
MLDFLVDMKTGQATMTQLIDIFNLPDYDFEFRRYQGQGKASSKEEIMSYFYNLNSVLESDIPSLRPSRLTELKDKHALWLQAYENPRHYQQLYHDMQMYITGDVLQEISRIVEYGLPNDADIGEIDIIITLSIGISFGYVFDGAFHIDLLQVENLGWEYLFSTLAHEAYHVALMKYESSYIESFSLEEWFIHFFSLEGLAVKFCNNGEGVISKPIYKDRPVNEGLDSFTMGYLNSKFNEALETFNKTLEAIFSGEMSKDSLWKHIMEYWYNCHTEDQQPDESPKLKQTLAYSFGNDFYGAIYDAFGKEVLLDCIRHPRKAVEHFRHILASIKI